MIHIPDDVRAVMKQHAERAYPEECCGLLIGIDTGAGRHIFRALPLANIAPDSRRTRYGIDPRAWIDADQDAAATGHEIIGVFHSHPDHPAVPSATDRAAAFEFLSYVILPVVNGKAGDPASFRLAGNEFAPEPFCPTG